VSSCDCVENDEEDVPTSRRMGARRSDDGRRRKDDDAESETGDRE
jgi:hypothetical protein